MQSYQKSGNFLKKWEKSLLHVFNNRTTVPPCPHQYGIKTDFHLRRMRREITLRRQIHVFQLVLPDAFGRIRSAGAAPCLDFHEMQNAGSLRYDVYLEMAHPPPPVQHTMAYGLQVLYGCVFTAAA